MKKDKIPQKKVKYTLVLDERQAKLLAKACEFYARVNIGQWNEIFQSCVDLRRDDYCEVRDAMEPLLLQARQLVWPELQGVGHSFGIGKFEHADIVWEIYEVLRNRIAWTDRPEGGPGVDFAPPMSLAGRELPVCTVAVAGRRCQIFNCDRRHGSYCCFDCPQRSKCKNACQNSPENCGQVAEPAKKTLKR